MSGDCSEKGKYVEKRLSGVGRESTVNVWTSGIIPDFSFTSKNIIRVHFEERNVFPL